MKKIIFILALLMPFILSAQSDIINFDHIDADLLNSQASTYYIDTSSTAQTKSGNLSTAKILVGDGAAGAPSMSFISNTSMGFYDYGSNTIGVSIVGVNRYRLSSDFFDGANNLGFRLKRVDASATIPTLIPFGTYTGTGIGSAGENLLSLIANSKEGIRIDGAVGGVEVIIKDTLIVKGTIDGFRSDGTTSLYFHEYNLPAISASAGGSGATLIMPTANTLGGYRLDATGETVVFQTHVENDWDGATDLIFEVFWEVNEAASADGTVDLKVIFYYKGDHEASNKTQTVEVAHTITGNLAQYTQHETAFTIDWDLGGNVVEAGDQFGIILNLETDTSECDDIIVNYIEFKYRTTKPAPETN